MSDSKYRVLILAEAANPEWPSVPLVGWSHSSALSKICSAHIVTQVRNRPAIERAGWKEGVEFTAIDTEKISAPIYKLATKLRGGDKLAWTIDTAMQSLVYPYFEYRCWKLFERRLREGEYDLVHRVTPVSPTSPSYIAKKLKAIGVPFVVGPMNGGVKWPSEFRSVQAKEKEWLSYVRDFYKLLPGYRALRKNASAILCGSIATMEQLPAYTRDRSIYLPENAINSSIFNSKERLPSSKPLRAAFVGRLVPYKGVDMAIEAMKPLLESKQITFDVYGTGPEEDNLKSLVQQEGLTDSVFFKGFVKHEELQEQLAKVDLFVFPSVREFGGGAVLEAMALGVVPVVVDYAGPSELVLNDCGYKVPICSKQNLIERLRRVITDIVMDPGPLEEKSKRCVERVQALFTWEQKAGQVLQIYKWVLGQGSKPDFGFIESTSDR